MDIKIFGRTSVEYDFFHSLKKGEVFGFSSAYTATQIESMAWEHGVKLGHAAKRSVDYGSYVFKVTSIRPAPSKILHMDEVLYRVEVARGTRGCKEDGSHVISKGDLCVVETTPYKLFDRVVMKSRNLCLSCADRLILRKINKLQEYRKLFRR
jgi:hypothetical protein